MGDRHETTSPDTLKEAAHATFSGKWSSSPHVCHMGNKRSYLLPQILREIYSFDPSSQLNVINNKIEATCSHLQRGSKYPRGHGCLRKGYCVGFRFY